MTIRQSRYILAETDQERRVRVTEVQRAKEDPFIRKSEIQQTVNNSTLPVSSRAVNLAIESVNSNLNLKADKTELEGLATEEYVNEKIEDIPQSSVNVVQTTGGSTADVMSQKAVSDEVSNLKQDTKRNYLTSKGIYLGSNANPLEVKIGDFGLSFRGKVTNIPDMWTHLEDNFINFTIEDNFNGSGQSVFATFKTLNKPNIAYATSRDNGQNWSAVASVYSDYNTTPDKNGYISTSKTPITTLTVSDMADTVVDNDLLTVTSGAVYRAIKQLTDQITSLEARVRELEDGGI